MLTSDYNATRSTVIAMNNFIQCSHCQAVQPLRLTLFLIKALTTITSKRIVYPCVRFSDWGSCLKFIKMRAIPFLNFSCWNNFPWLPIFKVYRWRRFHENHVAYRLALIHATCSSKPIIWAQSYPRKYTNCITPVQEVMFRHHYVMQKHSSCIETEKSYPCKVLHFNRQNLIFSPNDWAIAYGSYWKYPTEH